MELKDHIRNIIKNTFDAIDKVYLSNITNDYEDNNTNSRLIFPKYSGDKSTRVSEQELRFIFVDEFIKYNNKNTGEFDCYYSVETPTHYRYNFFQDNGKVPQVCDINGDGKSASIDLAIFSKFNKDAPIAIIEFKKDGCRAHEIAKDFLKLSVEPTHDGSPLRYFILISSSETELLKPAKNGKEDGLLQHFTDKLTKECFEFKNHNSIEQLDWQDVLIFWHRLPSNCVNNDFEALYRINEEKEERFMLIPSIID